MKRFAACVLLALLGMQAVTRAADEGPAKDVPQLQALQNYIGTWDVVIADGQVTGGESTARWILGGRFVEQSGTLLADGGKKRIDVLTLYTFDASTQSYRSWTFTSDGPPSQADMTWDAKSKTMTSVARPNAQRAAATVTADFSERLHERWKFVFTDRDGKATGTMSGVNTLRTEGALRPPLTKAAAAPGDRPAELKVLDRFLGTWRAEYRLPQAKWTPAEQQGAAELVFTRELGEQFVRERSQHSDQTTATMLMTFDPEQKRYRSWWFNSQGYTSESTGRWDEKSQTLSWTGVSAPELKSTSQHYFTDGGKFDWKVLVEDADAQALFRMEGTSARVKAPQE